MNPLAPEGPFVNEPVLDFREPENAEAMRRALARVADQLGHEYDLVIGGRRIRTADKIQSRNPARPAQVVGIHQKAEAAHAEMAIRAAQESFASWQFEPAEERAALLLRAARKIRARKLEFCAWLVYEVGKNWGEAEAEVGETIDFLEFYAREALRLARSTTPIQLPGEVNELRYLPLGVAAVISPWNFPLAIMAGMTSAAIATGNTVVLKPSSESPTIAARFLDLLEEAGAPPGLVNFCPGSGAGFGSSLVEHPKTRLIAFTGSQQVGLDIHSRAAQPRPQQIWIKRTILEMGGKDSIIVCADCNLEAAVDGVMLSAFGFSGQKCSACSRAIVEQPVYDAFLERLQERVEDLRTGDPTANPDLGPVVSRSSMDSILSYIEIGRGEGRLIAGGKPVENAAGGYFLRPTVFADVAPGARIAQEEIFGPVLAVICAKHWEEALAIANNTVFGLTGAVYSGSREKLEEARQRFHVGNLYLNRKCTGAMVGAHPFGGFNMSGTDSKAGGPDYLLLFTQAKAIAERRL